MFWRSCAAATVALCVWLGSDAAFGAAAAVPQQQAQSAAQAFLQEAEALYEAVNGGDAAAISRRAARTEQRLRRLPMQGVATAEGIEALARSVARMKRLAAAVSPDPDKLRMQAAEIRLAADAIAHPQAPMWRRYGAIMLEDLRLLEEAIADKASPADMRSRLQDMQSHYLLIRTAVLIHAPTYKVEKADSVLRYAERVLGAEKLNPAYVDGLVPSLRDAIGELFPAQDASASTPVAPLPTAGPPWGWSAFMGAFIVAVLSWVGWHRYRIMEPHPPRGSLPPARRGRR